MKSEYIYSKFCTKIAHMTLIFELHKIRWREGDHKKGKGSPYMLPLITVLCKHTKDFHILN